VTSRTRRHGIAIAAFVGAIAVSGCTFHPGQAAVVNGSDISQSTVDDLVQAGCSFFKASREESGGGEPATSRSFLRNLFTQNLITFKIIDKAATQMGLTVSPAAIAKNSVEPTLPKGLQGTDRELFDDFFVQATRSELQQAAIGAHLKDPSVTNADNVQQSQIADSRAYLKAFTLKQKVSLNPAYGTWSHGQVLDSDGSLSAAQSAVARKWLKLREANADGSGSGVVGLPPSQVCG
jgi:SurA N-terminal domain